MGAVSLAIGTAPFGIIAVGQLAEYLGPQTALAWSAGVGFVLIVLLWLRYPELRDRDHLA